MAAIQGTSFLHFLIVASLLASTHGAKPSRYSMPFNRTSFPRDFTFGAGTAAYQSEGAAYIDGKGPSIWDTFTKQHPEKIWDQSTGNVGIDFYHRYKEDVQLMKKMGLDSFRFSISWSRVLPKGKISGGVNPLGVRFYNNLINELLANGITPFVTLFHWDLPQALEDEYYGFLSSKAVTGAHLTSHTRLATMLGTFAPGRCSNYVGNCTHGNSGTEPYTVAHNLILGHAAAAKLYREKYQASQKGKIGITIVTNWFIPKSPKSKEDIKAAYRELDFLFVNPLTYGDYPEVMKAIVGHRLPKFTKEQSALVKGSIDFLGVNYYTTNYATNNPAPNKVNFSYSGDSQTILSTSKGGHPIGTPTALNWLFVYPKGMYDLMLYIKDKYKNPPIYITENGLADANNASLPVKEALKDGLRIRYLANHLQYLSKAIKEGVNVKGYYQWAFWDDFEWDAGYTVRFGLYYIDYKNNLKRYMKYSAYWFKKFLLH
uniref:Beta-glucosidase n=1 Tax=Salix viminalis TaxID=40686 RepID=A0A6N2KZQ7_SALVM